MIRSNKGNRLTGQPWPPRPCASGGLEIDSGHLALLAALKIEAYFLAFVQIAEAGALDRRDVDEDVLRAVLRLNEPEALRGANHLTVPVDISPSIDEIPRRGCATGQNEE